MILGVRTNDAIAAFAISTTAEVRLQIDWMACVEKFEANRCLRFSIVIKVICSSPLISTLKMHEARIKNMSRFAQVALGKFAHTKNAFQSIVF